MPEFEDRDAGQRDAALGANPNSRGRLGQRLIERFPNHQAVLRQLFLSDRDFRALCEEYKECLDAMATLTSSNFDAALRKEYTETCRQLEDEMLDYVVEHGASRNLR